MAIRVLPPEVVSRIAAGEVVERPASVVKELVENALDAGATDIRIEVRGGGSQFIRVVDNGCGIAGEEVELAFQRHATSKVSSADDLFRIGSLGFRGEALPSIASVSQVTMVTRTTQETVGTMLVLDGLRVVQRAKRGCPVGTTVTVRNLFGKVPVRRKFLRAKATEAGHIGQVVAQYALGHPHLRFTLVNDGRLSFRSTGTGRLSDVLIVLYGAETAVAMLPIAEGDLAPIGVGGYVSRPGLHRGSRQYLTFFLDTPLAGAAPTSVGAEHVGRGPLMRCIQSPMLSRAVEEAYHLLLPTDRHPIAVIYLTVPPEEVDVNIHPAKSQVKFLRDREVYNQVQKAVRQTLTSYVAVPTLASRPVVPSPEAQRPFSWTEGAAIREPRGAELLAEEGEMPPASGRKLPPLRVVGQMANTFIIAEGPDGIYLVDQHRAHERVVYQRVQGQRSARGADSQLLLEPLPLELSPRQMALLSERVADLEEIGFVLEPFGERTYLVRAVPATLRQAELPEAIREIVDQVVEGGAANDWRERLITTVACKAAVKAGQSLSGQEMRELLEQLEQTPLPAVCPHGAPVIVYLSQADLERQFGRR